MSARDINKCLDPHPTVEGVFCDMKVHPFGYHNSIPADLSWEGLPTPVKSRSSQSKKAAVVNSASPETRTGPPTGTAMLERPYTQEGVASAGWSGTDTSRDGEPLRAASQIAVMGYVRDMKDRGATVKECREALGEHHGKVSGALSVLAKAGRLVMTESKRDGCRVYMDPGFLRTP
jgi:hypothetical protein